MWAKNGAYKYELQIAFPEEKKHSPRRMAGSKRIDADDDENSDKSVSGKRKNNFSIHSSQIQERYTEFKKLLINEVLFHYDQNISNVPVEKRPLFNPIKEKVWPSYFNLERVPAIPPDPKDFPEKP